MSERLGFNEAARQADIIERCTFLLNAYQDGKFGKCELPEDNSPEFGEGQSEEKLVYFTLPMSLNYRRNSTQLWEAALRTYDDDTTWDVFSIASAANMPTTELGDKLTKYRMALQPTRHTLNWQTIAQTIYSHWSSTAGLLEASNYDYIQLKDIVQGSHKKGFPYLSGPKLFNYWSFILGERCNITLKNRELIDIAVDTHVTQSSIALGVISEQEALSLPTVEIAGRWRDLLSGTGIAPVDLNEPLWFWSRNGFNLTPQYPQSP